MAGRQSCGLSGKRLADCPDNKKVRGEINSAGGQSLSSMAKGKQAQSYVQYGQRQAYGPDMKKVRGEINSAGGQSWVEFGQRQAASPVVFVAKAWQTVLIIKK